MAEIFTHPEKDSLIRSGLIPNGFSLKSGQKNKNEVYEALDSCAWVILKMTTQPCLLP